MQIKEWTSALSYGVAATLLSHPFDTVKTRQQVFDTVGSRGFVQAALGAVDQLGAMALYRGFVASLASAVLFRSVPFVGYAAASAALTQRRPHTHPAVVAAASGAAGGLLRSVVECPAELVKVRRQLGQAAWSPGASAARRLRAVYTGLGVTALRNAAVVSLFWLFYSQSGPLRSAVLPHLLAPFVGGAVCSTAAWLVVYPLDAVKSRCQSATPTTVAHACRQLLAAGPGFRGFYAGLSAGLARSFIANGAGMAAYEFCQQYFN